jgi:hypothetical protein
MWLAAGRGRRRLEQALLLVRPLASIDAIRLVAELETRLGRDIDPTIVLDTTTFSDLAMALAGNT